MILRGESSSSSQPIISSFLPPPPPPAFFWSAIQTAFSSFLFPPPPCHPQSPTHRLQHLIRTSCSSSTQPTHPPTHSLTQK